MVSARHAPARTDSAANRGARLRRSPVSRRPPCQFNTATSFNGDLSKWDIGQLGDISHMVGAHPPSPAVPRRTPCHSSHRLAPLARPVQ